MYLVCVYVCDHVCSNNNSFLFECCWYSYVCGCAVLQLVPCD